MKNVLITGGCGFIGSHFVNLIKEVSRGCHVIVLDIGTYAAINTPPNFNTSLSVFHDGVRYVKGSIENAEMVEHLMKTYEIDTVVNFAAETHVDNSITNSKPFLQTNVMGLATLLDVCVKVWDTPRISYDNFGERSENLFVQISTDEVYGCLSSHAQPSKETDPINPRNPYSASKAAGESLVKAYINTYKLPALITRCCNNYGPGQHGEKLIPKVITNILSGTPIPVYGAGDQWREWIHATDHARSILSLIEEYRVFSESVYNIGSNDRTSNLDLIKTIAQIISYIDPEAPEAIITHVKDRPGHDTRYAIDSTKYRESPKAYTRYHTLTFGLIQTTAHYIREWKKQK